MLYNYIISLIAKLISLVNILNLNTVPINIKLTTFMLFIFIFIIAFLPSEEWYYKLIIVWIILFFLQIMYVLVLLLYYVSIFILFWISLYQDEILMLLQQATEFILPEITPLALLLVLIVSILLWLIVNINILVWIRIIYLFVFFLSLSFWLYMFFYLEDSLFLLSKSRMDILLKYTMVDGHIQQLIMWIYTITDKLLIALFTLILCLLHIIKLKKIYLQEEEDIEFLDVLNNVRVLLWILCTMYFIGWLLFVVCAVLISMLIYAEDNYTNNKILMVLLEQLTWSNILIVSIGLLLFFILGILTYMVKSYSEETYKHLIIVIRILLFVKILLLLGIVLYYLSYYLLYWYIVKSHWNMLIYLIKLDPNYMFYLNIFFLCIFACSLLALLYIMRTTVSKSVVESIEKTYKQSTIQSRVVAVLFYIGIVLFSVIIFFFCWYYFFSEITTLEVAISEGRMQMYISFVKGTFYGYNPDNMGRILLWIINLTFYYLQILLISLFLLLLVTILRIIANVLLLGERTSNILTMIWLRLCQLHILYYICFVLYNVVILICFITYNSIINLEIIILNMLVDMIDMIEPIYRTILEINNNQIPDLAILLNLFWKICSTLEDKYYNMLYVVVYLIILHLWTIFEYRSREWVSPKKKTYVFFYILGDLLLTVITLCLLWYLYKNVVFFYYIIDIHRLDVIYSLYTWLSIIEILYISVMLFIIYVLYKDENLKKEKIRTRSSREINFRRRVLFFVKLLFLLVIVFYGVFITLIFV